MAAERASSSRHTCSVMRRGAIMGSSGCDTSRPTSPSAPPAPRPALLFAYGRAPADLAQGERAGGFVGDPEPDVRGPAQLGGLAADGFEHGIGPEARRDEPAEPGERPEVRRGGAGPTGNTHTIEDTR